MFDALKSLFAEVSGFGAPARSRGEEGRGLAAAALLVNVANVGGEIGHAGRRRLKKIIEERFGLDANTAAELIALAEESDREAVDFYNFARVLKRTLDDDGRKEIVKMLWDVALADGAIHEFQANTIWRIAELLGVSTRDRVLLRQRVVGLKPADAKFEGPWSSAAAKAKA
jgi:uncharacterized tellurite resistance protein B-like protein